MQGDWETPISTNTKPVTSINQKFFKLYESRKGPIRKEEGGGSRWRAMIVQWLEKKKGPLGRKRGISMGSGGENMIKVYHLHV
jgi:hypothetical protein